MKEIYYAIIFMVCTSLQATKELSYHYPKGPQGELTQDFFQYITTLFDISILFETGTYRGYTTKNAIPFFDEVHSVELSVDLYHKAQEQLGPYSNVFLYQGSSQNVLDQILPHLNGNILFWLDAHWSGGETAHGTKATPIIEELKIIKKHSIKNAVIMINDLRYFKDARPQDYPDITSIYSLIKRINPDYNFLVYGDIGIAFLDNHLHISEAIWGMTFYYMPTLAHEKFSSGLIKKLFSKATPEEALAIQQLSTQLPVPYYQQWLSYLPK